jgi:hypothetical protein
MFSTQALFYIPSIVVFSYFFILLLSKEKSNIYTGLKKFLLPMVCLTFFLNSLIYVFINPYYSAIDEDSHFAYIQYISESHKLPLLTNHISNETLTILEGIYPKPSTLLKPESIGLHGYIYEAFQPPLYYLSALPFYWIGGSDFIHKIYAIRIWGSLQLLLVVIISYSLFQNIAHILHIKKPEVFVIPYLVFIGFTPAIVVRSTTIGNSTLPILFVTIILWWLSKLFRENNGIKQRDILLLGLFTGLAFLAKFLIFFLVPIIILLLFFFEQKKFLSNAATYLITILIILSPWFLFNKINYGTLTANTQAQALHSMVVNPTHDPSLFDYHYIARNFPTQFFSFIWIPEEINSRSFLPWKRFDPYMITVFVNTVWIIGFIFFFKKIITKNYNQKKSHSYILFAILSLSIITEIAQQIVATLVNNWPITLGRYFHILMPLVAVFFIFIFILPRRDHEKEYPFRLASLALSFALLLSLNVTYINQLYFSEIEEFSYFNKSPNYPSQPEELEDYQKNLLNIQIIDPNTFIATSNDPQIIINTDGLKGLEFNLSGTTGAGRLYYSFANDPAIGWYSEKYADNIKSDHVLINFELLEKKWGQKLTEIRIDPTDRPEKFTISDFKVYR